MFRENKPFIHTAIIEMFGKTDNIDMLINTSFNVAGDPIVFDAIDCYVNMSRLGVTYIITDRGLYSLKP